MKRWWNRLVLVVGVLGVSLGQVQGQERVVHFYNWSDYIAEDTLENFTQLTGIEVTYDVFDSNEVVEAKLLAGNTGFDVVVPTSDFLGKQIQAGVFQELDRNQLPNYRHLDPALMKLLEAVDPGNRYGVPYLWGTTGIGYNVDKVREALGEDAPVDSWDLVLKPENLAKLKSCGVSFLDAPTEITAAALNYLGKNPMSHNSADYNGPVLELLQQLRPHITYFHSSQYINDLANGDICVSIGWSGDILQAASRAAEADKGIEIEYVIPKEGALLWFDMMAVPKDAKNVQAAHQLINYVLDPQVIGSIANYVEYAHPNKDADPYVDEELRNNTNVFPSAEVRKRLYVAEVLPAATVRSITRLWTRVKTGY